MRFVDRKGPMAIQRSIYLGDDPRLISRVRELLAEWRAERRFAADGLALARQVNGFCRSLNRIIGRPQRPKRFIGKQGAMA